MSEMTSSRPYLVRALYQWICDNGMTPYLLVDAGIEGVRVPPQAVKDGKVVLNIAPRAVANLDLADDVISFQARFSGVSMLVLVPVEAVLAVYAMENGKGMVFPSEPWATKPRPVEGEAAAPSGGDPAGDDPGDGLPPRPPRGRPGLRVVK